MVFNVTFNNISVISWWSVFYFYFYLFIFYLFNFFGGRNRNSWRKPLGICKLFVLCIIRDVHVIFVFQTGRSDLIKPHDHTLDSGHVFVLDDLNDI